MGRTARGVRAIRLSDDDEVIGMIVAKDGDKVLTVTETGFGRISEISDYRVQSRGGKGLINYKTAKYGNVAAVISPDEDDDLIMISSSGIIIRIHLGELNVYRRPGKGVKVMRIDEGVKLLTVVATPHDENEITDHPDEPDADAEEGLDEAELAAEQVADEPVEDEAEE
ncbi:MAG: hypothetical protein IJO49_01335 [Clostridia bacterium]|nr:hypothetical protein [Clostridia bacterium]